MRKDFNARNIEKQYIDSLDESQLYINEREVWYVKLGINVGFEQNGKQEFRRPVLILKKVGNIFLALPLSTSGKDSKFYYKFSNGVGNKESRGLLSQIRIIDKKRMMDKLGVVSEYDFMEIKKCLRDIYDL